VAFDRDDALRHAEKQMKLGRHDAALAEYERVLAQSPDDWKTMATVAPIALAVLSPDNDAYVKVALPKVIEILGHKSNLLRFEAASALLVLGPKAAAAVPKLAAGLQDPDPTIRGSFLAALAAIGPESASELPAILRALNDPADPVRYSACHTIGRIGAEAREAIPLLEKNLHDRDEILQIASAWALVKIDPQRQGLAAECLDPLTRALKLADPQARAEAAAALGEIGPTATPAAPSLEALAQDPDEAVQLGSFGRGDRTFLVFPQQLPLGQQDRAPGVHYSAHRRTARPKPALTPQNHAIGKGPAMPAFCFRARYGWVATISP
jgi:tetratricopeptide (TPR) repeat protein